MTTNISGILKELDDLLDEGVELDTQLNKKYSDSSHANTYFMGHYEIWYTAARRVIAQLLPEREAEFVDLYKYPSNRKSIVYDTFRILDFLHGTSRPDWYFDPTGRAISLFQTQYLMLVSAKRNAESKLMDIKEVLAADLFDNEIDKARALHKNGLLREAGVIVGVVLESHLQSVANNHGVKIAKKEPTINDLNEPLKSAGIYDLPTFRRIQFMGDIRNLCDHKKAKDPTGEQVMDFIEGTEKTIKTVF